MPSVSGYVKCNAHGSHPPTAGLDYQVALFSCADQTDMKYSWIDVASDGYYRFADVAPALYRMKVRQVGGATRWVNSPSGCFEVGGTPVVLNPRTALWMVLGPEVTDATDVTWYYIANLPELNESEEAPKMIWEMMRALPKDRCRWHYTHVAQSSGTDPEPLITPMQEVVVGVREGSDRPQPERLRVVWELCDVIRAEPQE